MDGFIQPRDGHKEDNEKDEGHAPSSVEDDTMDNNDFHHKTLTKK